MQSIVRLHQTFQLENKTMNNRFLLFNNCHKRIEIHSCLPSKITTAPEPLSRTSTIFPFNVTVPDVGNG